MIFHFIASSQIQICRFNVCQQASHRNLSMILLLFRWISGLFFSLLAKVLQRLGLLEYLRRVAMAGIRPPCGVRPLRTLDSLTISSITKDDVPTTSLVDQVRF